MVERVKDPWRTSDGRMFASRAEAEKHEGRVELVAFFGDGRMVGTDSLTPDEAVTWIEANQDRFVALLRKAGVPLIVRERAAKVKPLAEPKKPAKVAADLN